MKKIKYYTLEVYSGDEHLETLNQHAFVSNNGKAVALCDQGIVPIHRNTQRTVAFSDFKDEGLDPYNCCENCTEIVKKLEDRETEVQQFYDNAVGEFHRLNYEIKEFEKVMAKLKLDRIKAESDIKKAEMRADEFGLKCFL